MRDKAIQYVPSSVDDYSVVDFDLVEQLLPTALLGVKDLPA